MMPWIVYLLVVSALLSLAAALLERWAAPRHHTVRWIWVAALGASWLLPLIAQQSGAIRFAAVQRITALPAFATVAGAARAPTAGWIELGRELSPQRTSLGPDRLISAFAVTSSALTIAWLAGGALLMELRRQRWRRRNLHGVPVLVSEDFGPAVLGVLRPQIVIPAWTLNMPATTQRLVLAHERSHIDAHDPRWLALALVLVAIAPWNLFLWWQLRRLRFAIEADCDRRILRSGANAATYASTLLDCSVQRQKLSGATTAMAGPASGLKRRIAHMVSNRETNWGLAAILTVIGAAASAVAATQVPPPHKGAAADVVLQQYTGSYEFSPVTVFTIRQQGDHLTAGFGSGARVDDLIDQGHDQFHLRGRDASVSFARDSGGQVRSATFHQNGVDTVAPRISSARLDAMRHAIESHVRSQQPAPGSEAALRHLIEGISSGAPDYIRMSAQLAGGTKAMLPDFQKALTELGAIRLIKFQGVNSDGWDQYLVQHEHAVSSWQIAVDERGTVVGALWHSGG